MSKSDTKIRRYYICSVAEPGADYESDNLARCEANSGHFMHRLTKQRGAFDKVRPGDIAILKFRSALVAYGVVSHTADDEAQHTDEWTYRIIVDKWIWHNPDNHHSGVSKYGVQWNTVEGTSQMATVKEISKTFGLQKIGEIAPNSQLYHDIKSETAMDEFIELLKANRNIILHGAPGTGKTHLAKAIADVLDAETDFVQFHPGYDYTDFVEGLRPVRDRETDTIGFGLRDGIFKKLCIRAQENIADSSKNVPQLTAERNVEARYNELVGQINDGTVTYIRQRSGKKLEVSANEQGNIQVKAEDGTRSYTVSLNRIKRLAERFDSAEKMRAETNIYNAVRDTIGGAHSSAYWAVLSHIHGMTVASPSHSTRIMRRNFVLIIDEINRGDISRIMGELFFAIDPGYRGTAGRVRTQFSNMCEEPTPLDDAVHSITGNNTDNNGWLFVPDNVYIIGTMNDIDRSVERMDFAMRRRFAFKEITAEYSMGILDRPASWHGAMPANDILNDIKERMRRLNRAIVSESVGLTDAYQVGAAYFLKYALYSHTSNPFDRLWDNHLHVLLTEYLRGSDPDGSRLRYLRDAYDGTLQGIND